VIVNPFNGPGPGPLPDENYTREIQHLNSYSNVQTIGYISTNYGKREIENVVKDVKIYAAWAEQGDRIGMKGIFLDETPGIWDEDNAKFLETVTAKIRSATGLGEDPLVS